VATTSTSSSTSSSARRGKTGKNSKAAAAAASLAEAARRVVRVAIYLRRSTDEDHQPYSIEAQETRLLAYIASQMGWELVLRFADDASGASTDRKDLTRALAAARAGLFDVLLVYRVDRFSRSLRDTVTLLDELDNAGVVFRSATEPFDTSTPMGRLLLQMLAMFAQFERDTIIDRVVAGMERKAARGHWMGGRRPFGYRVDKPNHRLIVDEREAAVVRLIFDLYVTDRLGTRAIANVLNDRGHRTTVGGVWSGHQVNRTLSNRTYLGELTFRDTTVTDTHDPIIQTAVFDQAEAILTARGDDHSHRASNASDYQLTGRLRCPGCGKAMIGTKANGRSRSYRYYTCFTRGRYGNHKCDAPRLDADAVDTAVLAALARFYRDRHDLITAAVEAARAEHTAAHTGRHAELAAVEAELTRTNQAIDRYLTAFENEALDQTILAARLETLGTRTKQLRQRRDELTHQIQAAPEPVPPATLHAVADHIHTITTGGQPAQRKALVEALIHCVKITGPDRLVPVFRIPQPRHPDHHNHRNSSHGNADSTASHPAPEPTEGVVRAMTNTVRRQGLEPRTRGLRVRCPTCRTVSG
jgi:site-specific DNA recombinase